MGQCYRSLVSCCCCGNLNIFYDAFTLTFFYSNIYIHNFYNIYIGDIIVKINNTLFTEQFSILKNELNPIILNILEKYDIGDNVAMFYFAALIRETLKEIPDKELKEAVITFIFDEEVK